MSIKSLVPVNVLAIAVEPAGQHVGDAYFNVGNQNFYIYNGYQWLEFAPSTPAPSAIDGGAAGTTSFTSVLDGGQYNQTVFESTVDGGIA